MSLLISTRIANRHVNTEWHIYEYMLISSEDLPHIRSIQADGDELEYILRKFENIPHNDARIQVWYGEWAIYIAANLKLMMELLSEKKDR